MEIRRTCLVGVSGFGSAHYETLMGEYDAGRAEIVGATVINAAEEPEKCARLRSIGCKLFDNANQMFETLKGQADICMLPVGIPLHRPMVVAALQAGMHVIVEKPAAGAIQDVRAMQEAARAADRMVAVGFQDLYSAEVLQLKQALLDGQFGAIEQVSVWGLAPRDKTYYARNNWAGAQRTDDAAWVLDSPANNADAHELMMAIFLTGSTLTTGAIPERIEAELYRAQTVNADLYGMRIATSAGVPIFGLFSHACPAGNGRGLRIQCSEGTVRWSRDGATLETAEGERELFSCPSAEALRVRMIEAVRQSAAGSPSFYCNLELASLQTLVINGAHEASAIHTVAAEHLKQFGQNGTDRVAVIGLDEVCNDALRERKLFSELDAPWARAGDTFDLAGYDHFSGGKQG